MQVLKLLRGIPAEAEQTLASVPYNELTAIERYIPCVNQFVAAVIILLSAISIAFFY
jgi:glutamate-1-semialdehyde aminotransferase